MLRENELLRTLRPRFNRMNVYPKACFFIGLERTEGRLKLSLTRDKGRPGRLFGAFKGAAWPFAALCRLLFIAGDATVELDRFPTRLLSIAPRRTQVFCVEAGVVEQVEEYLAGDSARLVEACTDVCAGLAMRTVFEQNLMLADLIAVEEFFERGPSRVKRLRERLEMTTTWVEPEVLVDHASAERLEPHNP